MVQRMTSSPLWTTTHRQPSLTKIVSSTLLEIGLSSAIKQSTLLRVGLRSGDGSSLSSCRDRFTVLDIGVPGALWSTSEFCSVAELAFDAHPSGTGGRSFCEVERNREGNEFRRECLEMLVSAD